MDGETITVAFDNQASEHVAADRLYYRTTLLAKVDKVVAVGLLLLGVIAVLLVGLRWWTIVWFVLAPLEWFNVLSFRWLVVRFWFKRNRKFSEPYRLDFDDSGVRFLTPSIDSRLAWDTYSSLLEDDGLLLLVYGPRMYTVIPKRAFESEEQLNRLRTLVRAHLPASA